MGRLRTADPLRTQRDTAADDGRMENLQRYTAGTNGAMLKHGMLARREYGLLTPAGTAVDPADAGDPGSEAGHGATADQDGREPEEEGGETQQRALPAHNNTGIGDKARGPPEWSRVLNA